jgi:hypothetical protein
MNQFFLLKLLSGNPIPGKILEKDPKKSVLFVYWTWRNWATEGDADRTSSTVNAKMRSSMFGGCTMSMIWHCCCRTLSALVATEVRVSWVCFRWPTNKPNWNLSNTRWPVCWYTKSSSHIWYAGSVGWSYKAFQCKFKPAYKPEQLMNQFFLLKLLSGNPIHGRILKKDTRRSVLFVSWNWRSWATEGDWSSCKLRVFALANKQAANWNWMKAMVVSWDWKIGINMIMNCFFFFSFPPQQPSCRPRQNQSLLRLRECLLEHSSKSDLVVMPLPMPRNTIITAPLYMAWLETLSQGLPPYIP